MASKKGGSGNEKTKAPGSSLPTDQQNLNQGAGTNTGAGNPGQSTPGTNAGAGGANTGTAPGQNAGAGTTAPGTPNADAAEAARLAEERRQQQEAERIAEERRKNQEAQALLAAQKNQPQKEIPALFISSRGESFRRCGFRFGKEPLGIALECLSEDQKTILKNEPNLVVEEGAALLDDLHVQEVV